MSHLCPFWGHWLWNILLPKNSACLGKRLKPPLSRSKIKASLNVRFSYSQTDQLAPSLCIKESSKLESVQLEPTFNSVSGNNPDLILPSFTAHPGSESLYSNPLHKGNKNSLCESYKSIIEEKYENKLESLTRLIPSYNFRYLGI